MHGRQEKSSIHCTCQTNESGSTNRKALTEEQVALARLGHIDSRHMTRLNRWLVFID